LGDFQFAPLVGGTEAIASNSTNDQIPQLQRDDKVDASFQTCFGFPRRWHLDRMNPVGKNPVMQGPTQHGNNRT
jgi:hypothetical protein